ncbi:MAG: AAA family ATPase [Chloroflexi bacterium]|nr:AAA family ATPase [Chloroflexota bacterium]
MTLVAPHDTTDTTSADSRTDPETAVLGALIEYPARLDECPELRPEHFYRPAHAVVFRAVQAAHAARGLAAEARAVNDALLATEDGRRLLVARPAFTFDLVQLAPTGAGTIDYWARQIIDAHTRRRTAEALGRAKQALENPNADVTEIRQRLDDDLAALAVTSRAHGPQPVTWADLWATPATPPDYIAGHILAAGKVVTIYSPGKAGKSLLAMEIAAALATGRPVIDDHHRDPMHVLYVDQEMTPEDWRDRLTDMAYGPDDNLERLHLYQLQDWPPLDTPAGGQALAHAAGRDGAQLVIIDTLSKTVAGIENDNDTQQAFYRHTLVPLKRAGATVLVLDHTGKDLTRGARGGSAKTDNVDLAWELLARGRDTTSLRRTHARFRHDMETIWLERNSSPLKHCAQPLDQEAEHLIEKCAEYMTAFQPNETTSRGEMAHQLRTAGLKFRNETISAAWRRVRQAHGWEA